MKHERRVFDGKEIRAEEDSDGRSLVGYAAVFDAWSVDLGGFVERVKKGTFASSLSGSRDVKALWSHESHLVLGSTRNGTLKMEEDEIGLKFRVLLPDTSVGRDAYVSVSRGDVTGVSFGFDTIRDSWERGTDVPRRTLLEATLHEISPGVAFPAYPQTDVAVRSLSQWKEADERGRLARAAVRNRQLDLAERA